MAYEPTLWKDRAVEKPRTYTLQNNPDGTVTLVPSPGTIVEVGTPVNANNLNKLEQGLKTHEAEDATDAHKPENVGVVIATKAEAEVGTSNDKYMTPLRVNEATKKSFKVGIISDNGVIPKTPGFSNYIYFVSPLEIWDSYASSNPYIMCSVNQSTRVVRAYNQHGPTPGKANYLEIAWG